MPYPQRLLNDGEEVALDLRPHWWYFSRHILTGIPLAVLAGVAVPRSATTSCGGSGASSPLCGRAGSALQYMNWTFTHFVVTSSRVIFRTGVFAKHGVEIPMDRIANINFNQSLWERVIGAGDIEIESAGRDGQSRFDDVWHPDAVQQELYRQMEAPHAEARGPGRRRRRPRCRRRAFARADVPEQIRQLADLRDRGAITAAEYEAKKAQLLERM